MSLPFENPDTTFDSFLQELPADYHERAIEFKAFTRSRKIKTPAHLMQVVMCYCGIDEVLREAAGNFTLLEEQISDTAIHNRLKACVPWVKALLTGMMGEAVKPLLEGCLRILVADGSTVQGPGASGIQYRLHIAIDLVRLHYGFQGARFFSRFASTRATETWGRRGLWTRLGAGFLGPRVCLRYLRRSARAASVRSHSAKAVTLRVRSSLQSSGSRTAVKLSAVLAISMAR